MFIFSIEEFQPWWQYWNNQEVEKPVIEVPHHIWGGFTRLKLDISTLLYLRGLLIRFESISWNRTLMSGKLHQPFLKSWRQTGTKQKTTYKMNCKWLIIRWAQLGLNQRPPDYESGALTS